MLAYEFSTQLTQNGQLSIPLTYAQAIPEGSSLRVILIVEEPSTVSNNGQPNGHAAADNRSALEALIARIQSRPSEPANIRPGNMALLAERLANPITEPAPDFDARAWNQQWAQIEADMNAREEEKERSRLTDFGQ